uniref:Pleckstrin homology-like domain family B member 1 n=1 Tax=Cyanistes caeruleus TaxID=156563 RepID=A0A8C0UZT5_CYACU
MSSTVQHLQEGTMEVSGRTPTSPTHRVQTIIQNSPLDLIDMGKGLKVQTEKPHLVSLGSGRLSTAITLLPLEEGECQGVSMGTLVTETLRCPLCWQGGPPLARLRQTSSCRAPGWCPSTATLRMCEGCSPCTPVATPVPSTACHSSSPRTSPKVGTGCASLAPLPVELCC